MPQKIVSQRTVVRIVESFREYHGEQVRVFRREPDFISMLYERDFPHWFGTHANSKYGWEWMQILIDLRNSRFFFPSDWSNSGANVTGKYLSHSDASVLGEALIQRLAAFASSLSPAGTPVERSLELDGFAVNEERLTLVPLEGPVSVQQEEDTLSRLVRSTGLPDHAVILKHMTEANSLYTNGSHHLSLNESRNMLQALIDGVSVETDKHGSHSTGLPGGTANRMDYLMTVKFLTADERAALGSAWGSLSAGSHPSVPEREQARIGLILALEFGQLLMLKFNNWKANAYQKFS